MAIEKVVKIDLTITQSKIKIKDLKKDVSDLDRRTLKYRSALQKLRLEEQKLQAIQKQRAIGGKKLITANQSLAKSTDKMANSSGLADTAIQELGRGVSDSAFGIRGMANNASQLGSLFTQLVKKTGGAKNAFKAMTASLIGPLGILVAFQAVTAIVQTDWFDALIAGGQAQKDLNDTLKEGSKIAGDSVTEFKLLTDVLFDKTASDKEQSRALRILKKDFKEFNTELITNTTNYEEGRKAVDDFTKSLIDQAKAEAALTLIKEKQGKILLLEEERLKKIRETGAKDEADLDRVKIEAQESLSKALKRIRESGADAGDSIGGISPEEQKEILGKRFDNLKDFNKDEIEELQKSIDTLSKLGDIRRLILGGGDEKKKKGKTPAELEEERQKKILEIREKFFRKGQDLDDTLEIEKIERQLERDELELERLDATEKQKAELRAFYARLIGDEEKRITDEFADSEEQDEIDREDRRLQRNLKRLQEEDRINKIVSDSKVKVATRTSQLLIGLGGKAAIIGKGIAAANVVRSGIEGVQNAYTTAQKSPITLLNPAYPITQAIGAGLFSAIQLQRILSSSGTSASGGGSSSQDSTSAPSFNLIQGTQGNQISSAISNQGNQPLQAFVVGSAVSTQQELDRNKLDESSI